MNHRSTKVVTDLLLIEGYTDNPDAVMFDHWLPRRVVYREDNQLLRAYLPISDPNLGAERLDELKAMVTSRAPSLRDVNVSRLGQILDWPGSSIGELPRHHYVVEIDPEAGFEDELADYYDSEQIPSFAAVQGTIRAQRFINHDRGPRWLTCFDLAFDNIVDSPDWNGVLDTAWSEEMEVHLRNTSQMLYQVVDV